MTGEDGAYVDCWTDAYDFEFNNSGVADYTKGSPESSINDMAVGDNTLSVGAYTSRSAYGTSI